MRSSSSLILLAILALFASCHFRQETYMHFEPTDVRDWDVTEWLEYNVPPVNAAGDYELTLFVRTSSAYRFPFKTLYLEARQQWPDTLITDTVPCTLNVDKYTTTGVSIHQYAFPVATRHLRSGDSLRVTLRHVMRKEEISGITDVGISLTKK